MKLKRFGALAIATVVTVILATQVGVVGAQAAGGAIVTSSDCTAHTLAANDDGSTAPVDLPFNINFYGQTYSSLWVNNNGNVTFNGPLSTYTPFGLEGAQIPIIAPFFADVDTRGQGSAPVQYGYGQTTFDGHQAFCVNWLNVGYYNAHADKLNSFQLLLVNRSDQGVGAFDIVFNYGQIQWETGDASNGVNGFGGFAAHIGFSSGTGEPGSATEFNGSGASDVFLDGGSSPLIHGSLGSDIDGRYVFGVRAGVLANKYVALGDSYQSGEGTFDYVSGTDSPGVNLCHRSLSAYPGLLVSSGVVQLNLDFRACSGATIATMVTGATSTSGPPWNEGSAQVSSLGITTKLVTVGIVGNDLQFATTVHDCIVNTITSVLQPIFSKSCQQNQGADVNARLTSLKSGPIHDNLLDLYRLIRAKAPYARVIVVSYPHFFPKTGAAGCGWVLRRSDQVWFNNGIDRADDIIGQAAREAGFEYVNMNTSNAGHEQCTDQAAMNGVTPNLAASAPESFHPNKLGHQLMEARLATKIGQTITPSFVIRPQETVQRFFTVAGNRFTVNVAWPGSDVETTLISPSGVRYTRDDARDAAHDHGQTWEYYDIANPEQGDWTIEMYGKQVSANGEPVTYDASTEPTPNQPPTAVMNVTGGGNTYSFDASASSDSDGTITDYMWDFGDGEVAFGPTATHTYAHAGSYAVALVTTDDGGAQGFTTSAQTLNAPGVSTAVFDGATSLTNNIKIHGATVVNGNFECNSNAVVTGTVTVHGNAHLTNLCHIAGDLIVAGDVTLDSTPTVDGSVRATGQVKLQSTVHVGHDVNGSAVISTDGKDDAYLTSHGVVGGAITRVPATAPAATPYSAFSYNAADWNGSTIKTWTAWMNEVAAANAAPSWSQGLTPSPGCVMAPWGSSVNGPNATVTSNTVIDARQATSGCAGVTLQQMTVKLAGDLTIVADKFSSTNGLTFTSTDGQAHTVRILVPGASACSSGHDVSLQAGTVSGDHIQLDVTAPGRLTVNGTSSVGGNVSAGCFSSSGTVAIGHD